MVVPVFMMSCQVSLKSKSGPDIAQRTNVAKAMVNAAGRPTAREAHLANRVKKEGFFVTLITIYWREHRGIEPAIKTACFLEVITVACPELRPFFARQRRKRGRKVLYARRLCAIRSRPYEAQRICCLERWYKDWGRNCVNGERSAFQRGLFLRKTIRRRTRHQPGRIDRRRSCRLFLHGLFRATRCGWFRGREDRNHRHGHC